MTAGPPPAATVLRDEHGAACLDGMWDFYPGDHDRRALPDLEPLPIRVPGLWEAQGHLELDDVAWYRLRFLLGEADGCWTLRFAAVMDIAEVWLNGRLLGTHTHAFTPFEFVATGALVAGENVLEVRVTDPPVDDPLHVRSAHGKQGWANHVFPSRPSLYMTYGGIWQTVTLRHHGPAVLGDLFVNADPEDLVVTAEVVNVTDLPVVAKVNLRLVGLVREQSVELEPGARTVTTFALGRTSAARWTPAAPALHHLLADAQVEGTLSDHRRLRFGLRTVRVDGTRMLVNDEPYRMKSVLVQGFRAEELYAEGDRAAIEQEILAARELGFTMLRLHIKAFDPLYLAVCDELGMLVHCDLPVAEPIAHEELGNGRELSRQCIEAISEQVRRDRNHPCIVLWSAMNELGLDREDVREWDIYEEFARSLYTTVVALDPTRPVIENDWVEPDPDRVFCSPVLTAHWYGRLHADYLDRLERQAVQWRDVGKPLFVTEFGDWGLPDMPLLPHAPFWDPRDTYAAGLASTLWPASIARFVRETQRYQGLSDRLQMEVFRRHGHLGGYCLTELTDVPHELNGVLDLHRRVKPLAAEEIRRGNQTVLPMLRLPSLVTGAGALLEAPLDIANDGAELDEVEVEVRFGGATVLPHPHLVRADTSGMDAAHLEHRFTEQAMSVRVGRLPAYTVTPAGRISIVSPEVPGNHDLLVRLRSSGRLVSENRYPVNVVETTRAPCDVALAGQAEGPTAQALGRVGARIRDISALLVVAEGELTGDLAPQLAHHLQEGGTVLVLAQDVTAAAFYPAQVEMFAVETAWGSSVFHFTTDAGALPSLPRRNVLVAEESTVQARCVFVRVAGRPFPLEPVVIAYKPVPGSLTGTVVGAQPVGPGRLLLCQYRLADKASAGDAAACGLLADLLRWGTAPRVPTVAEPTVKDDGRSLTYYAAGGAR